MNHRKTTTATRPRPATLLAPVTTVSREAINQGGTTNVGELISQTPGVTTDAYANPYGNRFGTNNANIDLRGLGNDRTLVLQNGRRYNANPDVFGPTGQFVPADIERVEVLRGPQGTSSRKAAGIPLARPALTTTTTGAQLRPTRSATTTATSQARGSTRPWARATTI